MSAEPIPLSDDAFSAVDPLYQMLAGRFGGIAALCNDAQHALHWHDLSTLDELENSLLDTAQKIETAAQLVRHQVQGVFEAKKREASNGN